MARLADGRFRLIGTISVAFGCPFEGAVDPDAVMADVRRFAALGVGIVTLGDTTGMATPASVRALYGRMARETPEVTPVAHFHDTRGTGLVNYVAALDAGVRYFDCAFGGVGGHPAKVRYGGGHTGNVATEDVLYMLRGLDLDTGVDFDAVVDIGQWMSANLNRKGSSRAGNAIAAKRAA